MAGEERTGKPSFPSQISLDSKVVLANGVEMPIFGCGLSFQQSGLSRSQINQATYDTVTRSLQNGIRLFDIASHYGNEAALGKALQSVPRSKVFITTKLWPGDYHCALTQFDNQLQTLGTDYIDLYLLHWPGAGTTRQSAAAGRRKVWKDMNSLYEQGKARAIGVSNFLEQHLEDILPPNPGTIPHVNQIEFNPGQHPIQLYDFCQKNNIQVEGYCPLGKGEMLRHPGVKKIAKKYNKSPAQALLRWSLQRGVVTIPRASSESHLLENLQIFDFELDNDDFKTMSNMHQDLRVTWNPTGVA
uniref:NADP-dependent oxidoreductase domain-containing protein n=1 Tax=Paramoeba aestuarina TaxID=180227 RepID=A0A7S4KF74_9EUKA|eukprot:CAMPEP_0201508906 /NCGR_PEP_ID=MMETSP0161_2-20130828/2109_1 /ASSEMBLY_ACC=CAM_ASM_000251 /TAXON_ID=180227 /ORGANISM="Neoparamoeba aestuarina, Strain SoJaBio B1-5/56/2" /LENGTH=300 /DNA_ID=CAMNT_0047903697 /DNA_START=46 /DNA_END=948 /DNA_ORIENTATION=+